MLIAQIIVSINNANVDKPFSYIIPSELENKAVRGMRVVVPFGRGNKPVEGFIVDIRQMSEADEEMGLKAILKVPDKAPLINEDLMLLAQWMQDKYYSTLTECIKCIMPAGIAIKSENIYSLNTVIDCEFSEKEREIVDFVMENPTVAESVLLKELSGITRNDIANLVKKKALVKNQIATGKDFTLYERQVKLKLENLENAKLPSEKTKQGQVIKYLQIHKQASIKAVKEALNITDSPINSLVAKDFAEYVMVEIRRVTASIDEEKSGGLILNDEQRQALEIIAETNSREVKKPILLHGVTGSGKTEVYLKAIAEVLKEGKQAIVLVPEISLTPQTVGRFKDRFGEKVSVTHSRLSMAERYDQWKNAAEGRVSIMIGPRSALFTPFKNLGIIIIDEEHENTYKSETTPKYDARLTAVKRAEFTNSLVVLGSATPSMESYYKAENGEYTLVKMKKRINLKMPEVDIVDMRTELEEGNRSIFSRQLSEALQNNLDNGFQTILFLNRRGHSTFVSCRQCGYVVKCDDCNINYTYHSNNDSLVCHYCGNKIKSPKNCPQCGSKYIKYFGVGTQRVEEEIIKLFPQANVLRMDMDTTAKKGGHESILSTFKNGRADILVGTQMIAKGLDFPKVTLVGVIAADLSLHTGDYRSAENTFQLLTQVSGRSGRAEASGKVIIQTYNPEHYAIQYAKTGDYESFYAHESALLRQMNYPPYSHVFSCLFTGESEKKVITTLYKLCDIMGRYNKNNDFEIIGPSPAVISKIRKRYRWKLLVKAEDETRLKNYTLFCVEKLKAAENMADINISLTLDPAVNP
ncbi:primosomal protein N' [Tyzzerella sp. OttesenSCG-928-J15]|nr:primosomal protein N' [Tyzzerella sp. OttesenSCG-928-J15]